MIHSAMVALSIVLPQYRTLMTVDAHPPRLRAASRLGRTAAAPIASAKGGRDSFAGDVIRSVDAAREQAVPAGTIPAPVPLPVSRAGAPPALDRKSAGDRHPGSWPGWCSSPPSGAP